MRRLLDESIDPFWRTGWVYTRVRHCVAFMYNGLSLSLSLSVFVTVCMHIYTCMYKLHTHTHLYMYVCINYVHSICFLFLVFFCHVSD
jgi:hypothetical protein